MEKADPRAWNVVASTVSKRQRNGFSLRGSRKEQNFTNILIYPRIPISGF
jgi:hypothetical protein